MCFANKARISVLLVEADKKEGINKVKDSIKKNQHNIEARNYNMQKTIYIMKRYNQSKIIKE